MPTRLTALCAACRTLTSSRSRWHDLTKAARLRPATERSLRRALQLRARLNNMAAARFAGQLMFDEQGCLNAENMQVLMQAPRELGQAAARLLPDLFFALVLGNPNLENDGVALFHSSHANYSQRARRCAQASLDTGLQKIGSQNLAEKDGGLSSSIPSARAVCYAEIGNARRLNRNMTDGADPLRWKCELKTVLAALA